MIKKTYPTIDLLKFIFAITVVAIHTSFFENPKDDYSDYIFTSMIFRLAVPFFFITSGFFYANKLFSCDKGKVLPLAKNYCLRLLAPLVLWGGFAYLQKFIPYLSQGKNIKFFLVFTFQNIVYPRNATWYLSASIIGIIILTFIYTRFKNWKIIWAVYSVFAFSFVLLCNNYAFLIPTGLPEKLISLYMGYFVSARNGVFIAPVFLGMGFLLRDEKVYQWITSHKKIPIITTITGFVLLFAESSLIFSKPYLDDRSQFISYLILIPSIVCVGLVYDIKLPLKYTLLRKLSTSIYYIHYPVRDFITFAFAAISLQKPLGIPLFLITGFVSIAVALAVYYSGNKKLQKFI